MHQQDNKTKNQYKFFLKMFHASTKPKKEKPKHF